MSSLPKGKKGKRAERFSALWGHSDRMKYIRDKSRAYLKVHLRDNRYKLHKVWNAHIRIVAY